MTDHRRPQVSVVMPVYNSEKYLAEAIESILTQTFTDFELVIVDDGSEDRSAAIISNYAAGDDRIRCVQLEENSGEAAARNAGLAAATCEYITGQDSDDISLPERLEKQARFLRSHPEVGAVGVHAHVVTEDLQHIYDREPPARHAEVVLDHYVGNSKVGLVCSLLMLRREPLIEVGGYDETLRYSPDTDLITRLLGQTIFANIAEPLYIYRRRQGQLTSHDNPTRDHDVGLIRQRQFERIWGEAPMDALERLDRVRPFSKLSWRERRLAKRDIKRLIAAFIAAGWVDAAEEPRLLAVMDRRLELVSPRLWQKFCYWRRHNFGETKSELYLA